MKLETIALITFVETIIMNMSGYREGCLVEVLLKKRKKTYA